MSKIEKFQIWAKKFLAIQDSHIEKFLSSVDDSLGLHESFIGKFPIYR